MKNLLKVIKLIKQDESQFKMIYETDNLIGPSG